MNPILFVLILSGLPPSVPVYSVHFGIEYAPGLAYKIRPVLQNTGVNIHLYWLSDDEPIAEPQKLAFCNGI